ncbi:MAG: hypothetical protein RDV48_27635 [Candidatus Eremiobacteraeota bacterium]|nr:hypothetical protein [Candidatus Eremiobacteraeota bacterium]
MRIKKLPSGNLLVPCRAEGEEGLVGDGMKEVAPGTGEYREWIEYLRETGQEPELIAEPPRE